MAVAEPAEAELVEATAPHCGRFNGNWYKGIVMDQRNRGRLCLMIGGLLLALLMLRPLALQAQGSCTRPLDVMILLDISSSMSEQLALSQEQIDRLIQQIQSDIPDSRFGFATFSDYPSPTYPDDSPWQLYQALTNDAQQVRQSIAMVTLQSGGDDPESYVRALYEVQDPATIGWRDTASRLVILIGDAPTHDPDPGRDGRFGTSDDLQLSQVLSQLRAQGIYIYAIDYQKGQTDFAEMARVTGGAVFSGGNVRDLLDQIQRAVEIGCATAVPVVPASDPTSTAPLPPPTSDGAEFPFWLCLPLLLIPLLLLALLFWSRQRNRAAIERGMPPATPQAPPQSTPSLPPSAPSHAALTAGSPHRAAIQPALVVGLGLPGRWSLTYLKEALADRHEIALLALDQRPDPADPAPPVALRTPDVERGSRAVALAEADAELFWLQDRATQMADHLRRNPQQFPRLAGWLAALDELDPQAQARLCLLDALRDLVAPLGRQIEDLGKRGGRDVYLVADMGDALGAAGILDLAFTLRQVAQLGEVPITLHALLMTPLPDRQAIAPSAVHTLWRSLDRHQLVFGRNPADPPPFDRDLLGITASVANTDTRLFDTCALLSADRDVASLVSVAPEHGLYPMIADAIMAELAQPASADLEAHRANVAGRVSAAQQRLQRAFYRSLGSFTYNLAPTALLQQASDNLLLAAIAQLTSPAAPLRIDPLLSELSQQHGYRLYTANPNQAWDQSSILGLLANAGEYNLLQQYASDMLPRQFRYERLKTHAQTDPDRLYRDLHERWFGADDQSGMLGEMLRLRADDAVTRFQDSLRAALAQMLNDRSATHSLSQVLTLTTELGQRAEALAQSLLRYAQQLAEQRNPSAVRNARLQLDQAPNWWRKLLGHVTSPAQDSALDDLQRDQCDLLTQLAAQAAASAATRIAALVSNAHTALHQIQTDLHAVAQAAQARTELATQRRRDQVLLGRVRHEWGLPHTDLIALRDYLDPERPLPQDEKRRRFVLALRQYLDGQHITDLAQHHTTGPADLLQRIHWTWQPATLDPVPQPVLINGDTAINLRDPAAWQQVATLLNAWIWDLRLADLLVEEFDQPLTLANQLEREQLAPAISYRPTQDDLHERFAFVIVAPSQTHAQWYEQVVAAQQRADIAHSYHHLLTGSDPYALRTLALAELIAPLQRGAMPSFDWLADATQRDRAGRTRAALTLNEALATHFEGRPGFTEPMHPVLVAALNNRERVTLFARALLCGVIGPDPSRGGLHIMLLPPLRASLAGDTNPHPDLWIEALRCFTLLDSALIDKVAERVEQLMPGIAPRQYDAWLTQPPIATLSIARSQPARELATLIQSILDPHFDA